MWFIISGYTEAMAKSGELTPLILYLLAASIILYAIITMENVPGISRLFLLLSMSLFLFMSFKIGFVRQGPGRIPMVGAAILMAAFLLPFVLKHKYMIIVLLVSTLIWMSIYNSYSKSSYGNVAVRTAQIYVSAYQGLVDRITNPTKLTERFKQRLAQINKESEFPILKGSVDIYSYAQTYLLASGNKWSPRPIIQSYSAYTPKLAELNATHLLGEKAPDHIIFKIQSIDERYPALEDGLSWPILIQNYSFVHMKKNFIYLDKKPRPHAQLKPMVFLNKSYQLGEKVAIPSSDELIFAEIEINNTLLGHLVSILYKPSQIQMTVELHNGEIKQYRMISDMAKSRFLLSPLIENTAQFSLLFDKDNALQDQQIKSINITAGRNFIWDKSYTLKLSHMVPDIDSNF